MRALRLGAPPLKLNEFDRRRFVSTSQWDRLNRCGFVQFRVRVSFFHADMILDANRMSTVHLRKVASSEKQYLEAYEK